MDSKTLTAAVRLRQWSVIIAQRRESGQTVRTWCRENGVAEKTYFYWQHRLRKAACEQLGEAAAVDGAEGLMLHQCGTFPAPGFTEVNVTQAALPEPSYPSQLHVELHGMRFTVDSGYPVEKLAMLLREMARPC